MPFKAPFVQEIKYKLVLYPHQTYLKDKKGNGVPIMVKCITILLFAAFRQ